MPLHKQYTEIRLFMRMNDTTIKQCNINTFIFLSNKITQWKNYEKFYICI